MSACESVCSATLLGTWAIATVGAISLTIALIAIRANGQAMIAKMGEQAYFHARKSVAISALVCLIVFKVGLAVALTSK